MHPRPQPSVLTLLQRLPEGHLPVARELFARLNYDYADEPLPLRRFTERERAWVHGAPRIIAQAGEPGRPFHIIHVTLSEDAPVGRGFPLSITAERALAQRLLNDHPDALLVFSDVQQKHWHLANVRDVHQRGRDGNGRLRRVLRRIPVGPQERLRTAAERVCMLDVTAVQDAVAPRPLRTADIKAAHDVAFDVSQVTKGFFGEYVGVFNRLKQHVARFLGSAEEARDYAQQFLNRVMFVYFVQRKEWLGKDPHFVGHYWEAYLRSGQPRDTFAGQWLDVLFFEAFNKRISAGASHVAYLPEDIRNALAMAPHLNGGLFERNELDSAYAAAGGTLPDALVAEALQFLEAYNFTIAEDTPLDQVVAVDPEMLGHVYESLVNASDDIDERGEAGIYYTPRIEIDLMCRLALVERLTNALGQEHRDVLYEAVFAFDPDEKEDADRRVRDHNLWPALDEALQRLTVCDPACGSGSFLVGMLHVLDDLQGRADAELGRMPRPYERKQRIIERSLYGVDVKRWAVQVAQLRLWLQLVVENDAPLEELQFEPLLPSLDFKLRVGDSLVQQVGGVDLAHRHGRDISPGLKGRLTNLKGRKARYFKSAGAGEARRSERRAIEEETRAVYVAILEERLRAIARRIAEIDARLAPRKDIFGETVTEQLGLERTRLEAERAELETQAEELRTALRVIRTAGELPFVWDVDFVEVFEGEAGGFDIVIGNPPYVRQEAIDDPRAPRGVTGARLNARKSQYKDALGGAVAARWPRSFGGRGALSLGKRSDLYVYFYLVGLDLLSEGGAFCFITSNAWLDVGYGAALQEFFLTRGYVHAIVDNEVKRSFAEADVNTVIALLGRPVDAAAARTESLEHVARFVMCTVPYEAMLDAVPWVEIAATRERTTRKEYRVYPATQRWLRGQGMDPERQRYTGDKWGGKYLRAPDIYWTILEKAGGKLVHLGDIAEVRRGITTGANEFFYLQPTGRPAPDGLVHVRNGAGWEGEIEEEFLRPVVKSPTECRRVVVDLVDLRYKLFMCHRRRDELTGKAALEYIRWAEVCGYNRRPSLAVRSEWWDLGCRPMVQNLWQKSVHERHVQPLVAVPSYVDQRLYEVESATERQCLTVSMNCAHTLLAKEIEARTSLGEGALDTAVYEAQRVCVVDPRLLAADDCASVLATLSRRIVRPVATEFALPDRQALDDLVSDVLGLTQGERDAVYEAVVRLVEARLDKAESVR